MNACAVRLGAAILIALSAPAVGLDAPIGAPTFADPRNPPTYRLPDAAESSQIDLGQSVFDSQWLPAGTHGVAGRVGLGPLFNAASCNACHHEGGRGQGPMGDGPAPIALVVQLESPPKDIGAEPKGDPVYGRVFNTLALDGVRVEGTVTVEYSEIYGYYYPFGGRWNLRVPHYHLVGLNHGPLSPTTVLKPRLAPALYGVGLLEAVPETAISGAAATESDSRSAGTLAWHWREGIRLLGRFGWQGDAVSIRDQTTRALANEMGLTSSDRAADDCTPLEQDCKSKPNGGTPEVPDELLEAVVAYLRLLAVPESPSRAESGALGSDLFASTGCSACHSTRLPVNLTGPGATRATGVIAPYTDLRLHDLGMEMADETASGTKVVSRWLTPPLWGLGYRVKTEKHPTFLHDGRARTTEEAVLWHSGEAARARRKFDTLGPRAREALLRWLDTL